MLPSGNDAAYALAEHFGNLIQATIVSKQNGHEQNLSSVRLFIKEMNFNALRLKMTHT